MQRPLGDGQLFDVLGRWYHADPPEALLWEAANMHEGASPAMIQGALGGKLDGLKGNLRKEVDQHVDKLKKAVFDIIAAVKKEGIGEDYLEKVRQQRKRSLETDLKENRFWARQLAKHYRYGTDPSKIVEDENKKLERVSSKAVQSAAATPSK